MEKNKSISNDNRTLAVNANSRDFLIDLGLWSKISKNCESIDKIIIKDYINKDNVIFNYPNESMGSVIFNRELLKIARKELQRNKCILNYDFKMIENLYKSEKTLVINKQKFNFKIIFTLGKNYDQISYKKIFF